MVSIVGRAPRRKGCSEGPLHSTHLPLYYLNTPTCLWKTVIEWVYVVKLINHINLCLLVGWLRAVKIRLMKLVNSSSNTRLPNTAQPFLKKKKRESVMTKLAIKIWLLIECLLLLMIGLFKKKDLEKGIIINVSECSKLCGEFTNQKISLTFEYKYLLFC